MFKLKEVVELSVGPFSVDEVLESIDNFFDGDYFMIFFMCGFVDDAVGAFADLGLYLIFPIDLIF